MKHLKLFENQQQKIWMYQETDESAFTGFGISTYLFDDEEILFRFILNKAYNIVKSSFEHDVKEEYFSVLDECEDYEAIIENIDDWIDEGEIENDNRLSVEVEYIQSSDEVQDWIQIRRNAKKYNL